MGWYPRYFIIRNEQGSLLAAAMCYIKHNSHGEFVFDWAWADAYQRAGMAYYPKLVCAAPFSPVQGPRLLVHPSADADRLQSLLISNIIKFCEEQQLSSFHCLFPDASDKSALQSQGLMLRKGYQFHWQNNGYARFDDFLAEVKSRKRKKIRRERQTVAEQGISFKIIHGTDMSDEQWRYAHHFYLLTFKEKGNTPALNREFFREVGRTMGDKIVTVFAIKDEQYIACAINFRNADTLYGRYWGCSEDYSCLHFEACFYQGIEYCIRHGLQRFEPGAQGEHKIPRGFLPTPTYSAHWLAAEAFQQPIADFLLRETVAMDEYATSLWASSPYRDGLYQPEPTHTQ